MKMRELLLAGTGALTLGSLAIPANAAPAIGIDFKVTAVETSVIDQVNYRRCWRHHGRLVCRNARRHHHNYGYAPNYDGGYYGYGPSIGLYSGGGGRGGHRGHRGGHYGHR